MATVATTTNTAPLQYPGTTKIDLNPSTGRLHVVIPSSTANTIEVYRSADTSGSSWALFSSFVRASVQEIGPIYCDAEGWMGLLFRTLESGADRIYYQRMDVSGAWSPEVLVDQFTHGGAAGTVFNGMDLFTVNIQSPQKMQKTVVAVGTNAAGKLGVSLYGIIAFAGYNPVLNNGVLAGTRQFLTNTGTGHVGPSLDLEHSGDGKYAANPSVWLAFGRTQLYTSRLAWNGGGWLNQTTATDVGPAIAAIDVVPARFDGNRFVLARPDASTVRIYERNRANTSTSTRASGTHPAGVVRQCSVSYNAINGDTRVYAVGTSNPDLYFADYTRATATWTGWTVVTTTDILGTNVDNWTIRRGSTWINKHDVVTAHSGAPNTIVHFQLALAYAPLAPTWVLDAVPYQNGSAADVGASLLLDWKFNDPDPADVQSAYALSRQIGAGALNYWRASDSTWQVTEQKNLSATTQLTLSSGWAAGTDANYTFRVKAWDSADVASTYSDGLVLVPSVKVNPTLTNPLDLSTYAAESLTVTWTVGEQSAFQVQLWIFSQLLYDSGKQVSSATSHTVPYDLINGFSFSILLSTWNAEGLKSTTVTSNFAVSFVAPMAPSHAVSPNPTAGYITVTATNPPATTLVAAGTAAQGNNVTLNPALPAGLAAGHLNLVVSAIENSGTGTPNTPAGYTALATFGNVGLYGKIAGSSETAPSVAYTGGVAGAATTAQCAAFRNAALATVGAAATQLNGSAANIATPALTVVTTNCVVIYIGWKQDGTGTSIATLAGFVELGDIVNSNGQMLVWGYQIQTAATNISSGSLTVTGGVSAISRAVLVAISGVPTVLGNDVYRLQTGAALTTGTLVGRNVAANGSVNDWRAAARTDWSYRVVANGDNGTSATGPWAP